MVSVGWDVASGCALRCARAHPPCPRDARWRIDPSAIDSVDAVLRPPRTEELLQRRLSEAERMHQSTARIPPTVPLVQDCRLWADETDLDAQIALEELPCRGAQVRTPQLRRVLSVAKVVREAGVVCEAAPWARTHGARVDTWQGMDTWQGVDTWQGTR